MGIWDIYGAGSRLPFTERSPSHSPSTQHTAAVLGIVDEHSLALHEIVDPFLCLSCWKKDPKKHQKTHAFFRGSLSIQIQNAEIKQILEKYVYYIYI